jgi:tetratricopeptide (TPR) repeat protein
MSTTPARSVNRLTTAAPPAPQPATPWTFEAAAACVRQADWPRARVAYEDLVRQHPQHVELRCNLGLIEQTLGGFQAALVQFNEAVRLQPDRARPYLLRADLHKSIDHHEAALLDYDLALLHPPAERDAQAHVHANRGTTLHALGRHQEALRSFDQAIDCAGETAGVHYNRGNVLRSLGRHEEAVACFDQALRQDAHDLQALFNRGLCLGALGRWQAALDAADAVLQYWPDHAGAHSARGDWLKNLGQRQEALAAYDRAVALDPAVGAAHLNRGNTLRELGRAEEALLSYDRTVELDPTDWEGHYNRGIALHDLRRMPQALQSYSLARRLAPQEHRIEWNEALALLMSQRWHEGWLAYESRWRLDPPDPGLLSQAGALWTGAQGLMGRRVLLVAEQGLGDTLQFCRYVPHVLARGAEVTLMVPEALRPLLQSLTPGLRVITQTLPSERYDFHCPLMSLPLALRRFEPEPNHGQAYLHADPLLVAQVLKAHPHSGHLRVGLAWSGNPRNPSDAQRSMALSPLLNALPAGVQVVVLQGDVRDEDEAAMARHPGLIHDRPGLRGFAGTAAWCEAVDLVITVDTSIAHLAGALGRPTWVMLHRMADWRWLTGRDDSPWYPHTRLFRQEGPDWHEVLLRVRSALDRRLQAQPLGPTVG